MMEPRQEDPEAQDPRLERAKAVVSAARRNAEATLAHLVGRFDFLRDIDVAEWNLVLTTAGVFIAMARLGNLAPTRRPGLDVLAIAVNDLVRYDPRALEALDDCVNVSNREQARLTARDPDSEYVAVDAIGLWIAARLLRRRPATKQEREFVTSVGMLTTCAFYLWWDDLGNGDSADQL